MDDDSTATWQRLLDWDDARPGLPGEHAITFLLGLALIVRPPRHPLVAAGAMFAGFALLARSASGRDGWLAALERPRAAAAEGDFVEVAAPWPYDRRVRVSAPKPTRRRR